MTLPPMAEGGARVDLRCSARGWRRRGVVHGLGLPHVGPAQTRAVPSVRLTHTGAVFYFILIHIVGYGNPYA